MTTNGLATLITCNFAHTLTEDQRKVILEWTDFLLSPHEESVFLLSGYAGTGKTSLLAALVQTMEDLEQPVILLAPTGRAAKVFSRYAGKPAHTIHRRIYRQKSMLDMDTFQQNVNLLKHTLFIVDEASMIANQGLGSSTFGTGRLLDDLIHFVYSGEGCRLLLVGDTAQLPPVGETESPALNVAMLETYGLRVWLSELKEVVRQASQSGILWNATLIRTLLQAGQCYEFPSLRFSDFPDVRVLPGNELLEALEDSYRQHGLDETVVVTRSNKRANIYNEGIRSRIFCYEEELCSGDMLMVARNDYFWMEQNGYGDRSKKRDEISFIANGDTAVVRRFRRERTLYGFRFADVTLCFPDYDQMELDVTVLLDTLHSEVPALSRQQQENLFHAVWEDYPEIRDKRKRMQKLREDIYYNALQIKYSYAVTCHKAQGGQWEHVYIDQGYLTDDMMTPDYFRWLYTALTRATQRVYLVNWKAPASSLK